MAADISDRLFPVHRHVCTHWQRFVLYYVLEGKLGGDSSAVLLSSFDVYLTLGQIHRTRQLSDIVGASVKEK